MLAIIGGSGLSRIESAEPQTRESVVTPYSDRPVDIEIFKGSDKSIAFLPRHGANAAIPPHRINYRANLWALHKLGVERVLGVNVVGGIHPEMAPGAFMVPDQLIDYTWGRDATFFDDDLEQVTHIDFTRPFDEKMRQEILRRVQAVNAISISPRRILNHGVYGCTQGPRLETAAEIKRLQRDGCDVAGMTAMPEAALARELSIAYAILVLSVNWGAGLDEGEISMKEISRVINDGMTLVNDMLADWLG